MVNILGTLLICISFAVGSYGYFISCHGDHCVDKCLVNCPRNSKVSFFVQFSPCSYGCIVNGKYEFHTEKDFSVCGTNKLCYNGQCLAVTNTTHCRRTYGFNFIGLEDPDNFCQYTCVPRDCKCGSYVESLPSETICLVGWSNKLGVCRDGVCIAKHKGSHSAHDEYIGDRPLFGQSIGAGRATPRGYTSKAECIARYEGLNPSNEGSAFIGKQENAYLKSQANGGRSGYSQNLAREFGDSQSRGSVRVTGSSIASSQQGHQARAYVDGSRLQAHQGSQSEENLSRLSAHSNQVQGSRLQANQGSQSEENLSRLSAHSNQVQGSKLQAHQAYADDKESQENQRRAWAHSNQDQSYSRSAAEAAYARYASAQSQRKSSDSASHSELNFASNALGGSGNVIAVAGEKLGNTQSAFVEGAGKVIGGAEKMMHGAQLISSSIGSSSIGENKMNSLKNTVGGAMGNLKSVVSGEHISAENAAASKYSSSSGGSESYSKSGSSSYSLGSSGSKSYSSGSSGSDLNLASLESGLLESGEYLSSSSGGSGLNLANIESGSWKSGKSGSLEGSEYESYISSSSGSKSSSQSESSQSFSSSSSSGGSSQSASFSSGGRDLDINLSL